MRLLVSALLVPMLAYPVAAQAPQADMTPVVSCMVEKTTADDEKIFKRMLIAALQDDAPQLKATVVELASLMLNLAIVRCNVPMATVTSPDFKEVGKLYGEKIGAKIMGEAMAKL